MHLVLGKKYIYRIKIFNLSIFEDIYFFVIFTVGVILYLIILTLQNCTLKIQIRCIKKKLYRFVFLCPANLGLL